MHFVVVDVVVFVLSVRCLPNRIYGGAARKANKTNTNRKTQQIEITRQKSWQGAGSWLHSVKQEMKYTFRRTSRTQVNSSSHTQAHTLRQVYMLRLRRQQKNVCNVRNCYLFFEVPACVYKQQYLLSVSVSATATATSTSTATATAACTPADTCAAHGTCCQFAIRRRICQIYRVIISKNAAGERATDTQTLNAATRNSPNGVASPPPCPIPYLICKFCSFSMIACVCLCSFCLANWHICSGGQPTKRLNAQISF